MKYVLLVLALLLPWLCGYIWLSLFESLFATRGGKNPIRIAGYGFFLGFASLGFVIFCISGIGGKVSYPAVMSTLIAIMGVGIFLLYLKQHSLQKRTSSTYFPSRARPGGLTMPSVLLPFLLIWIFLHFLFSFTEVFSLPVYPWDAWLLWVYRAKAWFFAGELFEFLDAGQWFMASASASAVYTVDALDYPLFASIIPFWVATSLGYWSDTLVNVPGALCGVAICLALYGQCRDFGLNSLRSLLVCYFLISIPILGTHLALGGYADIWMAGFAGLGFVALIQGSIRKNVAQIATGVLMVALSAAVKNEGLVWLLAAMVFLVILHVQWKKLALLLGAFLLLVGLFLSLGVTTITLPFLGEMGVSSNQLILPFFGTVSIQVHNLWEAYLVSFFALGSWNLFWPMVIACILLCLTRPAERSSAVALVFVLLFISTQTAIFVFSSHGEWAARYTAINRLPLHFTPALLFAVAVVVQKKLESPGVRRTDRAVVENQPVP